MSNELGAFLRARRADASLDPPSQSVGSTRLLGLRREELAAQAGISVDYYTRLEQGRENNPSDSVMNALARVLRLEPDAVDHLYQLRDSARGLRHKEPSEHQPVADRMVALVEAVRPNPAYILDRLSNVVAANPEGLALFDGLAESPPEQRNTCRYLVTHPRAKKVFLDWEEIARGAVAHLRAANAHDLDEPALRAMVAELAGKSLLFADWWEGHIVQRSRSSTKRIRTADGLAAARRYEVLHLPEEGLRMTLWLQDDSTPPAATPAAPRSDGAEPEV